MSGRAAASRRRLTTVLFIDMVSSTERAASLGDHRWQELLTRFRRVVRRSLRTGGGREVDNAGDGFFAVFDEPARALACACSMTEALRSEGIEIRSGLHTGEVEQVGGTLSGIAVHIGARVAAQAEAGQVLVSSTVRDIVHGSDYSFIDLGTRSLKGVPGEWRLFSVIPAETSRLLQPGWARRPVIVASALVVLVAIGVLVMLFVLRAKPASLPAAHTIVTVAGTGAAANGIDGQPATKTAFTQPVAIAVDADGRIYIVESNRVRRIDANGSMSTVAGTGVAGFSGDSGPADAAELNTPQGIAIDSRGDLYIADTDNNRVRMVDPSGKITSFAGSGIAGFAGDGGPAVHAQLNRPIGVAIGFGGTILIGDSGNNRVRAVMPNGIITTFAGAGDTGYSGDGGAATSALLDAPTCIAVDANDDVYIADTVNDRVRLVTVDGTITTFAGTGETTYSGDSGFAKRAALHLATGPVTGGNCLAVDNAGDVFIADALNNRIREVAVSGIISTVAGNGQSQFSGEGGAATSAALDLPLGIAVDSAGNVYVADTNNNRVRRIS